MSDQVGDNTGPANESNTGGGGVAGGGLLMIWTLVTV